LNTPQNLFKIEINAVENRLSGLCLIADRSALVIVEGCRKSQSRFHKLMMRRINWNLSKVIRQTNENWENHSCSVAWQGVIKARMFPAFKSFTGLSTEDMQNILIKHHAHILIRYV